MLTDVVPAPKSTLLLISSPRSMLDATLLKSSSESMGLSDVNVWGVAGSAASTCTMLSLCEVLLAFRFGSDVGGEAAVVVEERVLSSLRLRVTGGVLVTLSGCSVG